MLFKQTAKTPRKFNYVFWIAGLLAAIFVAATMASALVDWDKFKPTIESKIMDATGRKVTIAGKIDGTLFPMTHITARDITVANVDGGKTPYLLKLSELQMELSPLSLLSGQLDIGNVTLVDPDLNLEKISDSKNNWQFSAAPSDQTPNEKKTAGGISAPSFELRQLTVKNGRVQYIDHAESNSQKLSSIDMTAELRLSGRAGKLHGSAEWQSQNIELSLELNPSRDIGTDAELFLSTPMGDIRYDGQFEWAPGGLAAKGRVTVDGKIKPVVNLQADLNYGKNKLALDNVKITGDVLRADGNATVVLNDTPTAALKLNADAVDAEKIMAAAQSWSKSIDDGGKNGPDKKSPQTKSASSSGGLPVRGQANISIGKLTYQKLAMDHVMLQLASMDGKNISVQRMAFQSIGNSAVEGQGAFNTLTQNFDGKMTASVGNLPELAAAMGYADNAWLKTQSPRLNVTGDVRYGGKKIALENYQLTHGDTRMNGDIQYGMGEKPDIHVKSTLRHPSIKQLAGQPLPVDSKIDANADIAWQMGTTGIDWNSMQGNAKIDFLDGIADGVDLKKISDRMKELNKLSDFTDLLDQAKKGGKTPFRALTSEWIIARGIANSNSIHFDSDVVKSNGGGTVDLGKQQLDIRNNVLFTDHPKVPALGVRLFGDIKSPQNEFDTGAIAGYFATRAINKAIEKNVDTDKLKDKLNRSIDKKRDKLLNKLLGQ